MIFLVSNLGPSIPDINPLAVLAILIAPFVAAYGVWQVVQLIRGK